jgi:hypothetical protein
VPRAALQNGPAETVADLETERLRALAAAGLSLAQAAQRLGVTRNTVIGRARDRGVRFNGPQFVGGGCNSDQALKGWATRRERAVRETADVG